MRMLSKEVNISWNTVKISEYRPMFGDYALRQESASPKKGVNRVDLAFKTGVEVHSTSKF